MSNAVSIFKFEDTADIRVVEINGNPWFVAADVCRALGLDNASYVTKRLEAKDKDSFKLPNQRGSAATIVTEAGLYKLAMRSDTENARRFQDWIASVVLPAIRKDGAYIIAEEKVATGELDEDTFVLKAMQILERKVARLKEEKEQLFAANKEMAPKAVVFDNCVALQQESLAAFARTLEGLNTNAIKRDLLKMDYLYQAQGSNKYRVYSKYRDVLFTEKLMAHPTHPYYEIIPTAKGKQLIVDLYRQRKLTMKKAFA